jgi:type IV pilus assembly protein PilY1
MKLFDMKWIAFAAAVTVMAAFGPAAAWAQTIPVTDAPLFTTSGVPPLMMMVMSRDEQLFNKAYSDYTDLDNDSLLDTTYQDRFDYSGYFDPAICYTYSSGVFTASSAATGTLAAGQKFPHQCSSKWSGNFLNWVTMSRLDMLRFVLYGGYRSTDTTTSTVLERAPIPNDLHAWVKVYLGSDINSFTPLSQGSGSSAGWSFCNATMGVGTPLGAPLMRAAQGTYTEWAATALQQCTYGSGDNAPSGTDYTVRVSVCGNASARESFCEKYTNTAGVSTYKPVGLLQTYGEKGLMRFGLVSGTYSKPRSGGVLRRNIGLIGGNTGTLDTQGCAPGDEVNLTNGVLCTHPTNAAAEGIIKTMNGFRLTQWGNSSNSAVWNDCNTYGILNRNGVGSSSFLNDPGVGSGAQNCSAWGNPLSEMYAEALRYISAGTDGTPSSTFTGGTDLSGLPTPSWVDPYGAASTANSSNAGGNPYCASCSILVLASGLNSFDSDELPTVNSIGTSAAAATTSVGAHEPVSGQYLVGRVVTSQTDLAVGAAVNTYADLCTSKGVADLSLVRGICPDIPPLEGSYLMDGLAWKAWTTDLRPNLLNSHGQHKPADAWNQVQTYTVALAENLPKFQIPVGGGFVTLAPLAQANNTGTATAATTDGWRSSFLGSVTIGPKKSSVSPNYVYGRPLAADNTEGSFSWVWEDSLWGNDHDNDVVTMVTYCVGAKCAKSGTYAGYTGKDICWRTVNTGNAASPVCGTTGNPTVAADEALVRIENLSAYAGNAMLTGYTVAGSGTATDGPQRLTLRPGGQDNSILTSVANPPASWYAPMVKKFKYDGTTAAKQLENPLYYAAKYGGFTKPDAANPGKRRNPVAGETPDAGDWEVLDSTGHPTTTPGTPNNYFLVRDPTRLKDQLQKVFDAVLANSSPSGSVSASAGRFTVGQTLAYQASYSSDNWTGDLKAFNLNPNGSLGTQAWTAASQLPAGARSDVWISTMPDGTSPVNANSFTAKSFTQANLPVSMRTALTTAGSWPTGATSVDNIIAYLKGDQTQEEPAGNFRKRATAQRLGDIVNSSPQTAYKLSYGYDQLAKPAGCGGSVPCTYPSGCDATCVGAYQAFFNAKSSTTVFVGANDGMLHAFNGAASGGNELFSFIPYAVSAKLGTLPKPGYVHTFFVDGTPAIGDAYISGWKTLLIGSAGAGAPSVFALDITTPSSFGASSLRWEFNSAVDASMGQFTGIPSPPTLTADGNWVTAFGNGYNSTTKKAKLFVLNVNDGSKILVDDITNSANIAPNGLATATIVDAQGTCPDGTNVCADGIGDTIYAGDYQGNVWKWQLNSAHTKWVISANPLFQAKDTNNVVQPITSGMYAVSNPLGGIIIYFGTGKYLATTDNDPNAQLQINSIYAIWDNGSGATVTRSELQPQVVNSYVLNGDWTITQNQFGYASANNPEPIGKMGWFLDLTVSGSTPATDPLRGERVVAAPSGTLGQLFVNVFRPTGDVCLPGGLNSFLDLDALNGAADFGGNFGDLGGGTGGGSGIGGHDIGNGPPLNSPNPVVSVPGQTGIPQIGCEPTPGHPCTPNTASWCSAGVPGAPYCPCANPSAPPGSNPSDPICNPPPSCTSVMPGYPYCANTQQCSITPNAGTPVGNQAFQCRASWRQLR